MSRRQETSELTKEQQEELKELQSQRNFKKLKLELESRQKIEDAKIALAEDKEANLKAQRKIDNEINQNPT